MEQTTVRLPEDLKAAIAETGRPASDVIRDSLRQYFHHDTRAATVEYVNQCIKNHLREYHTCDAVEDALVRWGGVDALVERVNRRQEQTQGQIQVHDPAAHELSPLPGVVADQELEISSASAPESSPILMPGQKPAERIKLKQAKKELEKRERTKAVLRSLLGFFSRGKEPTSSDISNEIGLNSKAIGRILHSTLGMVPVNTRVNDVPARYWQYECQPVAEEALKRLESVELSESQGATIV